MSKTRRFYEDVLGLKVTRRFSKNFVEYDIGAGTLSVGCAPGQWEPSKKGTCAALEIADFPAAVAHLKKKRVKSAPGPRENPRGWMVGVRDPDGNLIVLHRRKDSLRWSALKISIAAVGTCLQAMQDLRPPGSPASRLLPSIRRSAALFFNRSNLVPARPEREAVDGTMTTPRRPAGRRLRADGPSCFCAGL